MLIFAHLYPCIYIYIYYHDFVQLLFFDSDRICQMQHDFLPRKRPPPMRRPNTLTLCANVSPFLRWDGTHARSFQRLLIPRIFSKTVVFNPCSLHSHEKSFCSWTCIPCSKMSASQVLAHLQISLDDAGVVSMAFAGIDGVLQTPKAAKINKRMFKTTKPSHI